MKSDIVYWFEPDYSNVDIPKSCRPNLYVDVRDETVYKNYEEAHRGYIVQKVEAYHLFRMLNNNSAVFDIACFHSVGATDFVLEFNSLESREYFMTHKTSIRVMLQLSKDYPR